MNVFPAPVVLLLLLCCAAAAVMPAQYSLPGARSSSLLVKRRDTGSADWNLGRVAEVHRSAPTQFKWLAPRGLDDDGCFQERRRRELGEEAKTMPVLNRMYLNGTEGSDAARVWSNSSLGCVPN
jgi:hypothetical protein